MEKKLYRSRTDKQLCGVCAGLAKYFEMDVSIVRLITVLAAIFVGGGLLAYIVCAIVIPEEPQDNEPVKTVEAETAEHKVFEGEIVEEK